MTYFAPTSRDLVAYEQGKADAAAEIKRLRAALSAKDEEVKRLREAAHLMQRIGYITSRVLHGYGGPSQEIIVGVGLAKEWNACLAKLDAALSPRTAAMEHIAQERAEEIEEETR